MSAKTFVKVGVPLCLGLALPSCSATIDQSSFAPRPMEEPVATLAVPPGYAMTEEFFDLPDLGRIHAVRLDNPDSDSVILYNGGNGNFVSQQSDTAAAFAAATGTDIILYDYPGRGGTEMPSTLEAYIDTGPKFLGALANAGWTGKGPLYAYGLSFGGTTAAAMARNGDFDGLILEGSATDYLGIGQDMVPGLAKPFVKLRIDPALADFDYYGYITSAKAPVLLISSADDKVVRERRMKALADRLKKDGVAVTFVSVPGEHGSATDEPEAMSALAAFMQANQ